MFTFMNDQIIIIFYDLVISFLRNETSKSMWGLGSYLKNPSWQFAFVSCILMNRFKVVRMDNWFKAYDMKLNYKQECHVAFNMCCRFVGL